jgi:hypothetical protein
MHSRPRASWNRWATTRQAGVRLLRPTRAGRAVTGAVTAAIDDIEQRWRSEIGDTDWNRLRSTLARMQADAEIWSDLTRS